MSDSELSDAPSVTVPPDAELKESLRQEVRKAIEAGSEVTVRKVRDASAQALELPEGFYTSDKWKSMSKEIIHAEHDRIETKEDPSPEISKKVNPNPKSTVPATKRGAKAIPSTVSAPPKKKRKSNPRDGDSSAMTSDSSDPGYDQKPEDTKASRTAPDLENKSKAAQPSASKEETIPDDSEPEDKSQSGTNNNDVANGSDSEMSVVLDDEPATKRRGKSKETTGPGSKQSRSVKPKVAADDDPDKEEIKKLQGWLVKCGVRKVWGKELKPYETSKAKIKHLRGMLVDIGMTGRFSNEKASQIKEARELAADIEAVQEGAQRWGKDEDSADDGDNKTRGGRRIVRGAKNYDFLSSDGEETD